MQTPTRVGTTDRYRYAFTGDLPVGAYTIEIRQGSIEDTGGETNIASTQSFSIEQPRATLIDPAPGRARNRYALGYIPFVRALETPQWASRAARTQLAGPIRRAMR